MGVDRQFSPMNKTSGIPQSTDGASNPGVSGFQGTCDDPPWWKFWDLGHGCTGVIMDDGQGFTNVQDAMRDAMAITDKDAANAALDSMAQQMGDAPVPDDATVVTTAAASLVQAFDAIGVARAAIAGAKTNDDAVTGFSQQMGDAAAKCQIYLNQLTAGKVQLQFAKDMLFHDLAKPIQNLGIDLSWIFWGALALGAAIIIYKVAK